MKKIHYLGIEEINLIKCGFKYKEVLFPMKTKGWDFAQIPWSNADRPNLKRNVLNEM